MPLRQPPAVYFLSHATSKSIPPQVLCPPLVPNPFSTQSTIQKSNIPKVKCTITSLIRSSSSFSFHFYFICSGCFYCSHLPFYAFWVLSLLRDLNCNIKPALHPHLQPLTFLDDDEPSLSLSWMVNDVVYYFILFYPTLLLPSSLISFHAVGGTLSTSCLLGAPSIHFNACYLC
jgi:hypothetical protein